jgi:prephenate dehydratase
VATCNADQIDDIIVEIHQSGLELVALHDRPEGSELGKYYYVIEVVKEDGITAKQIEQIEKIDTVRFAGTFDVAVK